jgi:hypothetical protein
MTLKTTADLGPDYKTSTVPKPVLQTGGPHRSEPVRASRRADLPNGESPPPGYSEYSQGCSEYS